jgi:hypothetical protein
MFQPVGQIWTYCSAILSPSEHLHSIVFILSINHSILQVTNNHKEAPGCVLTWIRYIILGGFSKDWQLLGTQNGKDLDAASQRVMLRMVSFRDVRLTINYARHSMLQWFSGRESLDNAWIVIQF